MKYALRHEYSVGCRIDDGQIGIMLGRPSVAKAMRDPHEIPPGSITKLPSDIGAIRITRTRLGNRLGARMTQTIAQADRQLHRSFDHDFSEGVHALEMQGGLVHARLSPCLQPP